MGVWFTRIIEKRSSGRESNPTRVTEPKFLFPVCLHDWEGHLTETPTLSHRLVSRGFSILFQPEYWRGPRTFQLRVSSPSLTQQLHCLTSRNRCQVFFWGNIISVASQSSYYEQLRGYILRGPLECLQCPHWHRGISLPSLSQLYYLKFLHHCQVFFFVFFWVLVQSYPDSNWCTDPDPMSSLILHIHCLTSGVNCQVFSLGYST